MDDRPGSRSKGGYLPHIDGLRAIAVLGVLLYHLKLDGFSGGFVGVDVFFVISGFLISGIITFEVSETGQFDFARFYIRRVRRLFPALFFTLTLSFLVGSFVLFPSHFQRLSGAIFHAIVSLSNFYFWSESGYFDEGAGLKPLLHTWSLGVEEQFYLIWPLLLVLLFRFLPRAIIPMVLLCIGLLSFYLNHLILGADELLLPNTLGEDLDEQAAAAFFLTPFRIFELVIGALMVWIVRIGLKSNVLKELFFLIGLSLILYSMFFLSESSTFPYLNALPPCLGSAILIYAGQARFCSRLLSNPVSVAVGKWSYSIYLIHWPLIVFYRHWKYSEIDSFEKVVLGAATIIVGFLMYKFIEQPFRYAIPGKSLSSPAFGLVIAGLALLISFTAAQSWVYDGWPWRFSKRVNVEFSAGGSTWTLMNSYANPAKRPVRDQRKILFLGDSQVADFLNLVEPLLLKQNYFIQTELVQAYCGVVVPPEKKMEEYLNSNQRIANHVRPDLMRKICGNVPTKVKTLLTENRFDRIVLASLWYDYHMPYFENTIRKLKEWSGAPITVIGNKGFLASPLKLSSPIMAYLCLSKDLTCNSVEHINRFAHQFLSPSQATINSEWLKTTSRLEADFLDLGSLVCQPESCLVYTADGIATFKDNGHFSNKALPSLRTLWGGELSSALGTPFVGNVMS